MIPGCTSSGAETAAKAGARLPAMNEWQGGDLQPVRKDDIVEKCTFCLQRTRNGRYPACVEIWAVGAWKFGNLLDPKSEIRWVLENKNVFRLKEDLGTEPKFWYFSDDRVSRT